MNQELPNRARSNPPILWVNQAGLSEPLHGCVQFGSTHLEFSRHDRIGSDALLHGQLR
ncbi:MAG: hypothetical protein ACKOF3_04970 [Spartobacteria bacterium]